MAAAAAGVGLACAVEALVGGGGSVSMAVHTTGGEGRGGEEREGVNSFVTLQKNKRANLILATHTHTHTHTHNLLEACHSCYCQPLHPSVLLLLLLLLHLQLWHQQTAAFSLHWLWCWGGTGGQEGEEGEGPHSLPPWSWRDPSSLPP